MPIVHHRPSSRHIYPDNTQHDHGVTERELQDLLRFVHHLAQHFHERHFRVPGTVCYEEYQDRGLDALIWAWGKWTPAYTIPFYAYARAYIWRAMHSATRLYKPWESPRPPGGIPFAEALRPLSPAERDAQHARLHWLDEQLTRHRSCLTPTLQRALDDFLTPTPAQTIAAREGISLHLVYSRKCDMVNVLKRHVVRQETTCEEESTSWRQHPRYRTSHAVTAAEETVHRTHAAVPTGGVPSNAL